MSQESKKFLNLLECPRKKSSSFQVKSDNEVINLSSLTFISIRCNFEIYLLAIFAKRRKLVSILFAIVRQHPPRNLGVCEKNNFSKELYTKLVLKKFNINIAHEYNYEIRKINTSNIGFKRLTCMYLAPSLRLRCLYLTYLTCSSGQGNSLNGFKRFQ